MPNTTIKCRWINGFQEFYESTTPFQTVDVMAPFKIRDDFDGILGGDPMDGTIRYSVVEVDVNTAIAPAANIPQGAIDLIIDSDANAQDSVLYFGDQLCINLKKLAVFETRLAMHVLPTTATSVVTAVWGLGSAHNLDKDAMVVNAWFRMDGTADLKVETDDTGVDNNDKDTGIDLVAEIYHVYRIDFGDLADVKFYVDGVRYQKATTFDMSTLTDAEAIVQPYFSLDKTNDAPIGTMRIDSWMAWSGR